MKKNFHALGKRALALLIVLTMCVSLLQVTAFAAPGEETTAEPVGDVVQQPEETTEPETKDPVEETTEPETKEPAEETTEPETKEPAEETTEPETKEPVEETTEPETKAPVENATESETKAPVKDVTETKTEPVVVMKPAAAPVAPVTLPSISNTISSVVGMLNAAGSKEELKCPECGGTNVVAEKDGYVCRDCDDYVTPVNPGEKPSEPEKHEHSYGENDRCACGELDPKHVHKFDETGKCKCGEEHKTHTVESWIPDYLNNPDEHMGRCTVCGEVVREEHTFGPQQWGRQECTKCIYYVDVGEFGPHEHEYTYTYSGNNKHIGICTAKEGMCTAPTIIENCVFDQKGADPTCNYCVCGNSKSNVIDLEPGDGPCKNGHTWGTVGKPDGNYYHEIGCTECGSTEKQACTLEKITDKDGKPIGYCCRICGQWKPIEGKDYCSDANGHKYEATKEVLSEDGKTVLTIQTCQVCGFIKIQSICTSPAQVTVHYVYEDGKTAHVDQSQAVIKGTEYKIESPTIDGYKPDQNVVSGISDGKGKDVTVTYKKVEVTKTFKLTIHYQKPGGETVFPDKILQLEADEEYNVPSPKLHGYTPEWETVSGKMPDSNEVVTVKYTPTEYKWTIRYVDENDKELAKTYETTYTVENVKSLTVPVNPKVDGYRVKFENQGMPDSEKLGKVEGKVVYMPDSIPTHTLTIKYVFENGQEAFGKHEAQLQKDESYNVPSRELLGYTPDQKVVSVTMPDTDLEITVTYKLDKYTWTINYVDENGNKLFDSSVTDFDVTNIKSLESVTSPTQKGYTADKSVVNAPTELDNVTVTVTYKLSADFNLTVIHRYVNRDGTVIEVTQDMVKHQIGDPYTTQPVARSGYTLSATPENATGVFGAEDVTVVYVYNANAPTGGGGGGTPPVNPNPPEEPNPPVGPDDPIEVPDDPNVPLEPGPGTDDPQEPGPGDDVIIDDPNVPLAPGPDIPDVDIDDPDVPMTNKPTAPAEKNPVPQPTATGLTEIEDEDVPLAEVPQTGDNTGLWIAAAILAACGLVTLGKKREDA